MSFHWIVITVVIRDKGRADFQYCGLESLLYETLNGRTYYETFLAVTMKLQSLPITVTAALSSSSSCSSWFRNPRTSIISFRSSSSSNSNPTFINSMETQPSSSSQRKIVVCGGGVIGVCTAYFLAKKANGTPTTITLVEKSSIACAASGKAGGFLALDWCDGSPLSQLARTSFQLHRDLAGELDGEHLYGYRPLDALSLTFHQQSSSSLRSPPPAGSGGIPSWIDGKYSGEPKVIGTTKTTAQVHPQLFTQRLLSVAVEEYGVEVVKGEVKDVRVEDQKGEKKKKKVVLSGENREIEADAVVLALGPWSSKLAIVSSLFQVRGIKAQSIVLLPKNPSEITQHALFLNYTTGPEGEPLNPEVYPRPTGEVYVCGMSEEDTRVPEDPEEVLPAKESIEMLKTIAGTVSSKLGRSEVVAEQACILPIVGEDGRPVIGEIPGAAMEGVYVATGHGCWGILNGPATGAAMAELVLEGKAAIVDLKPFSPTRFL